MPAEYPGSATIEQDPVAGGALAAHAASTTDVHGIGDTARLVTLDTIQDLVEQYAPGGSFDPDDLLPYALLDGSRPFTGDVSIDGAALELHYDGAMGKLAARPGGGLDISGGPLYLADPGDTGIIVQPNLGPADQWVGVGWDYLGVWGAPVNTEPIFLVKSAGDTYNYGRFQISGDGSLHWGDGDTPAASHLRYDPVDVGGMVLEGAGGIGGALHFGIGDYTGEYVEVARNAIYFDTATLGRRSGGGLDLTGGPLGIGAGSLRYDAVNVSGLVASAPLHVGAGDYGSPYVEFGPGYVNVGDATTAYSMLYKDHLLFAVAGGGNTTLANGATPGDLDLNGFRVLTEDNWDDYITGGGGGAVDSVNGEVGVVVLDAADVGAAPAAHTHPQADVTGLVAALAAKQDAATAATDTEVAALIAAHETDTTAIHGIADTAALVLTGDARLTNARTPTGAAGGALSGAYPDPGFAVDMAEQSELDAVSTVAGAALPKAGGTMTGAIVLAADPSANLHPATKQWVAARIADVVNGAPGTLDTLNEIASQLASDESAVSALTSTVAGKLAAASNLSDLVNAVTARTNLGLGSAATHAHGDYDLAGAAAAAQAASQPLDADLTAIAAVVTAAYGRSLLGTADAAAALALLGTDASTATRVPTDASVTLAKVDSALKPSGSAASTDESLRRLGTGSTHAAAGDDSRFPTAGQKNALSGTSGTPGSGNEYVTKQDPRLSTVLAKKSWSQASDYTITSTTTAPLADVDATNLAVTFTAPASGDVIVILTAGMQAPAAAAMFWGLKEGTSNVGSIEYAGFFNSASPLMRVTCMFVITGLSAGSHTLKWGAAVGSGSGKINVGNGAGAGGPATMVVLAA